MNGNGDPANAQIGCRCVPPLIESDVRQTVSSAPRDTVQQACTREPGDERIGRSAGEIASTSELQQTPVDDHTDRVGENRSVLKIVRDENRRQPQFAE